jgi:hypothetical protein
MVLQGVLKSIQSFIGYWFKVNAYGFLQLKSYHTFQAPMELPIYFVSSLNPAFVK